MDNEIIIICDECGDDLESSENDEDDNLIVKCPNCKTKYRIKLIKI